jgi:small-conductance mechanosensitive channel
MLPPLLADIQPASNQPLELFGTRLIGVTAENGRKLLIMIVFLLVMLGLNWALRKLVRIVMRGHRNARLVFWTRQGISLSLTLLGFIGLASIWFDNPTRLSTFVGLVTAGVAFALQKPISAIAGYLIILRGKTFNVGDRIVMGGVRGDVIALGFTQTTIMEMGQPPSVDQDSPGMWVHARQYTGRIVTITNSKVFDEPVFNYTREFPFLWEEMRLPISYRDDRKAVEQILLDVADKHTRELRSRATGPVTELQRRYFADTGDLEPKVFWRLTDNWVELTVRFVTESHGVRNVKDAMSRDIIAALDERKIGIASGTYEIVGLPPIKVQIEPPAAGRP